ncbi:MAG: hypothetical protein NVSMB44_46080 [Ktedonobacteraceae bacterium]
MPPLLSIYEVITTFGYVPPDLIPGSQEIEQYLNVLNAELLTRLQKSGEASSPMR